MAWWVPLIQLGAQMMAQNRAGKEAAKQRAGADKAMNDALQQFMDIKNPSVEELEHFLPQLVGEYQSVLEASPETLGDSKMEEIQLDPRLKAAQMQALESMSRMGEEGLTDIEKAELAQIQRQAGAQATAQQNALLQELASRGAGGSGLEVAARLQAGQSQADRASQQGMMQAAQAQQRALTALSQAGSLGGSIRGQEFGEQSQKAQSADAISRFNLEQKLAQQRRNVEEQRRIQHANLAERQRIAEQQANMQRQLREQAYQRQLELARARSQTQMDMTNILRGNAQDTANRGTQMGAGIGQMIGLVGKNMGGMFGGGGQGGSMPMAGESYIPTGNIV